jgi:ubiquinone/menaquinone biosynthesis C-methylase UbiE
MKRASGATELLDGPLEPRLLAGNLRDLARVNRWLGGNALSWRGLAHVLREVPRSEPVRFLDVGTGGADIPLALARRARQAGRLLDIVALDVRTEIVEAARRAVAGEPGLSVEKGDGDSLDHPAQSFDVVHASLVLHHLEPPAAGDLLLEMARVANRAVIVNDLVRARHLMLAAWALSHVATGNRYTRHDAPLSVRRAYQPDEVVRLAAGAGLVPERLLRDPLGHRYALVLRHSLR